MISSIIQTLSQLQNDLGTENQKISEMLHFLSLYISNRTSTQDTPPSIPIDTSINTEPKMLKNIDHELATEFQVNSKKLAEIEETTKDTKLKITSKIRSNYELEL